MGALRDLVAGLGYSDVRTLLQSGNVVFRGKAASGMRLEAKLASLTKKLIGVETDFFVRSLDEWQTIVARNPFPQEALRDPGHLVMMCLRDEPSPAKVKALQASIAGREKVKAVGKQAYLVYPDGIGESRLTIALIEKKLETRGTGRNWNTVLKLQAMASEVLVG
jgi:uncharacterized protein (DUF1697 family)